MCRSSPWCEQVPLWGEERCGKENPQTLPRGCMWDMEEIVQRRVKRSGVSLYWWQLLFISPTDLGPCPVSNSLSGRGGEETLSTSAALPGVRNQTLLKLCIQLPLACPPPSGNVSITGPTRLPHLMPADLSLHLLAWRQASNHKLYPKQTEKD